MPTYALADTQQYLLECYLSWAQTKGTRYTDLMSAFVDLWEYANAGRDESDSMIEYPDGSITNVNVAWSIFRSVVADLRYPESDVRTWADFRDYLYILDAEIHHIARLKEWMTEFVHLNHHRHSSSKTVLLPGSGSQEFTLSQARFMWILQTANGTRHLYRLNLPKYLKERVEKCTVSVSTNAEMVQVMENVMKRDYVFHEFLNVRAPHHVRLGQWSFQPADRLEHWLIPETVEIS
ncbi:hypothetical protein CPB85DRAFT_1322474 [Mucidula mucida]|nr:hypothetical protein CPB85DRAFT_1322474 [Mucidula mucida]